MDTSTIKIDGQHRLVALESIKNSRDAVAWKLNNESKYLDEYREQYHKQQSKCDSLRDELAILDALVTTLGGSTDEMNELSLEQQEVSQVEDKEEFTTGSFKRVQYPSSPKEKLKELVLSGSYLKSDDELLDELQKAFDIPMIPKKTVVNYLLELKAEGSITRVKSTKRNTILNGAPDWFNDEGLPFKKYVKE